MQRISASLVVYKNPVEELEPLLVALRDDALVGTWVVLDNAATEDPAKAARLNTLVTHLGGQYIAAPNNLGFGAGHNLALQSLHTPSEFHLMVNPDIAFAPHVLASLAEVMDARPEVGLILPRVLYPDGTDQYLCKLLPAPLDFALRRFAPHFMQRWFHNRMDRYELRGLETHECNCVPFLSGCFLFALRATLDATGGFDERYFLYMEDVDLCRRFAGISELLYWPGVSVTHGYHRGAHRNVKLMRIFLQSAIRYFNKWGWFVDAGRRRANRRALEALRIATESPDAGRE